MLFFLFFQSRTFLIISSLICTILLIITSKIHAGDIDLLYRNFIMQRMMVAKIREYADDPAASSLKQALAREAVHEGMILPDWLFSKKRFPIKYKGYRTLSPSKIDVMIKQAAKTYGINPTLIKAVVKVESAFNHMAVSRAGAKGLMQIMDETANEIGLNDPFDPVANIHGGTALLKKYLMKHQSQKKALICYNAGESYLYNGKPIPKETKKYISNVFRYYQLYKATDHKK